MCQNADINLNSIFSFDRITCLIKLFYAEVFVSVFYMENHGVYFYENKVKTIKLCDVLFIVLIIIIEI